MPYHKYRGNELFCEVDEEFILDQFNLYGLSSQVPNYNAALDVILDNEDEEEDDEGEGNPAAEAKKQQRQDVLQRDAAALYGLIHARFIVTPRGLSLMLEKYRAGEFGRCPRVGCQGQAVLPVGISDLPRQHGVRLYCPRCEDVYLPRLQRHVNLDGAYWGTSFPHLFLLQYPDLLTQMKPPQKYVAKIFGFKLRKPAPAAPKSAQSQPQPPQQQPQPQATSQVPQPQTPQHPPPSPKQSAPQPAPPGSPGNSKPKVTR